MEIIVTDNTINGLSPRQMRLVERACRYIGNANEFEARGDNVVEIHTKYGWEMNIFFDTTDTYIREIYHYMWFIKKSELFKINL